MSSSQRSILSFFTTEAKQVSSQSSAVSPFGADSLNDNSNGSEARSEVGTLETARQPDASGECVTEELSLLGGSPPALVATSTSVATQIMIDKFHPLSTFKFPKRQFGTTTTSEWSFHLHWCDEYDWLHYDTLLRLSNLL